MSAQKELQLLHLQEQHGTLQAERDGLKGELKHLTTQHYKAQKEAQEQAYRMMVSVKAFCDFSELHLYFYYIIFNRETCCL